MAMYAEMGELDARPAQKREDECPDLTLCYFFNIRNPCACDNGCDNQTIVKVLLLLLTLGCIALLIFCTYSCVQSKQIEDELKLRVSHLEAENVMLGGEVNDCFRELGRFSENCACAHNNM